MESKVKEYQELYEKFEHLYEQISNVEEPIQDIEKEIKQYRNKQSKVDYNNPDIVVDYMQKYIDESIAKKKEQIKNQVNEKAAKLSNPSERLKKNFNNVIKWLSVRKVDKYLANSSVELEEEIWIGRAEKATGFNVGIILNTICSFVFRFDFLRFAPKAVRVIVGIIFWIILLVPTLIVRVYNKELGHLSKQEFDLVGEQVIKDFAIECVSTVAITLLLIVVINTVIYFVTKYLAKKFLMDNKELCCSIIDLKVLKQKMYDHSVTEYMKYTVGKWKREIETIKKDGLNDDLKSDSLTAHVKNELYEKYCTLEQEINGCKAKINEVREKKNDLSSKLKVIASKLKNKESEVDGADALVINSGHNSAVLSPYVSAGFSQYSVEGVKELIYFKHNYKPMLICYNDKTLKEGERFRKNVERLIELLMKGFFNENYFEYISMWLVDYEGLYFPESRTKGMMKVINTQQGLQKLFDELKVTRDTVNSLFDGRIWNINPERLGKRENPIKYNIVYFVGHDFTAVEREITQLFIGGENFGFLPIVFMKNTLVQSLLQDDGYSKLFARVVEKMKNNNQIYQFEELVHKFEIDLMVSNQKRLLDERLCVNKILSMEEFLDAAESDDGFEVDNVLYIDTYQLEEVVYDAISDSEFIKFFTINGEIPEFVTKEVINL